jgi:hypothetical protein
MASSGDPLAIDELRLIDEPDVDEDLWASPSKAKPLPPKKNVRPRNRDIPNEKQDACEEALRRELQSVRKVNEAVEEAIESLSRARNSMKVFCVLLC